ncbi:MAG TPA: inositol monophosphatase family protein [Gemmatimonadales bacterium]|nr:inositol monophosphatase family protein [Gemmatimonadales bacterium]
MITDTESLMQAVAEVARASGDVALRYYRSGLAVETKGDGSPVTLADRAAEQLAREWIARRFPADGIVGEEFGVQNAGADRRWIIDPIDGTKSFVRGVPLWGTLVAVAEGDQVLAGAAYFPAVGELVSAATSYGCWADGVRVRVSPVSSLAAATVLTTDDRFPARPARRARWEELARRAAVARTWGDCYGYLLVATGRAEVMTDDVVAAWDAAALLPVITEAGGVFTDWNRRVTAFGSGVIATNAALAEAVREQLCETNSGVIEALRND